MQLLSCALGPPNFVRVLPVCDGCCVRHTLIVRLISEKRRALCKLLWTTSALSVFVALHVQKTSLDWCFLYLNVIAKRYLLCENRTWNDGMVLVWKPSAHPDVPCQSMEVAIFLLVAAIANLSLSNFQRLTREEREFPWKGLGVFALL